MIERHLLEPFAATYVRRLPSLEAADINEVIDEHLSINISFWTASGLKEKKEQGYVVDTLPYALVRPSPDNTKDAVPDPGEARIVRTMYERYATGTESYGTLAVWLNEQGLRGRRGMTWSKDTVREILINATYAGYVSGKRAGIEGSRRGKFEPIVGEQLWERARAVRQRRTASLHGTRPTKRSYLLAGLVICGRCGARMNGLATGRQNAYRRYACANRVKRHSCDASFARGHELERDVTHFVHSFRLNDPDFRDSVLRRGAELWRETATTNGRAPQQTQARLARLRDLYELGDIERADYISRKKRLEPGWVSRRPRNQDLVLGRGTPEPCHDRGSIPMSFASGRSVWCLRADGRSRLLLAIWA